ncbi:hypothetical protein B0T17DRAFT_486890 [Bombardia bombarda]|uniref:Uncharacterized protein n=1 Tax=Bombardia bombarda TaxID=252184 RepID=A0AA39X901_9PEZI|nr:hypothetical protein B0T17DRAFT_486890 [Bombardia bombarda]
MPYHYHLKFELYATPYPAANGDDGGRQKNTTHHDRDRIWIPTASSTIFDHLPSHPRSSTSDRQQSLSEDPSAAAGTIAQKAHTTLSPAIIDCGATRPTTTGHKDENEDESSSSSSSSSSNTVHFSERQWRARSRSFPPPGFSAGIGPRTAAKDWRFGRINIESFDLVDATEEMTGKMTGKMAGQQEREQQDEEPHPAADLGPNLGGMGQATKARYVPLETKNTEAGWGIVHLYREGDESSALRAVPASGSGSGSGSGSAAVINEDEGTILCIPAVPGYLSPSDFLGFVGEKWRGDVSHYRMVMTSRVNRYMVLMKFRDSRRAREWRKEFDGKPYNSMESEICHVTYIKSITVETPNHNQQQQQLQEQQQQQQQTVSKRGGKDVVNSLKPFPPPTPSLIELPTCPVCLERMDDTAGLMTILCQHVFHCTCLQTWKGSGCPVCRATNPAPLAQDDVLYDDPNNPYSRPFGSGTVSNLCSVCDTTSDLWICLICGNVGCGRYKGGHAKDHWKETAHSFSLELETQHVWDYAGDMWVHRLIRDKGDGKVVELPSNNNNNNNNNRNNNRRRRRRRQAAGSGDVVPRAKLDNIGLEYTHLLTSQLESQRIYFEEMVSKAADKAAKAAAAAEQASAQAHAALHETAALRADHALLRDETIPALERELARERTRAAKSTELARGLTKSLQEERQVSAGLMQRIEHLNKEAEGVAKALAELKGENEELRETNRDLTMFISGQERLRELESEGVVGRGEVEEGVVSVPQEEGGTGTGTGKGKRKGKGKGKK